MEYGAGTAGNHSGEEHRYQGSSEAWFLGRKHSRSNNLLFSKAHAHVRLNALSAGLSPGSKKRLEAQAKIGTHSRFVRPCQASALLTWYTSDLWYTSLICAKAKMMDLTGNGNITGCNSKGSVARFLLTILRITGGPLIHQSLRNLVINGGDTSSVEKEMCEISGFPDLKIP